MACKSLHREHLNMQNVMFIKTDKLHCPLKSLDFEEHQSMQKKLWSHSKKNAESQGINTDH